MLIELTACCFGANTKTKENSEERAGRLLQRQQSGIDARALRQRRARIAKGREPSSLWGAGEGVSLGAGL
jgi:hypothetical protein